MLEPVKPKALEPGGLIGIVSPAGAALPERVHGGLAALEAMGYRTRLFPHALARGPLYYAGTVAERLADLHAAFADEEVDAIVCTRGGWGSAELLPGLDRELICAHAKPFIGYSDMTSLHVWLRNECGQVTFQGPMVAADWYKPGGVDLASWQAALGGSAGWSLGAADGLRVLRPGRTGRAAGELSGGCLSIYAEALGTPWAPVNRGGVLFLEDVGVRPYQWDRMLVHLRHAGMLAGVQGIVLGDMAQSCGAEEQPLLERAILHALADFEGPVAIGLRSGHLESGNITLPFGVQVELDLTERENPQLHVVESATRAPAALA